MYAFSFFRCEFVVFSQWWTGVWISFRRVEDGGGPHAAWPCHRRAVRAAPLRQPPSAELLCQALCWAKPPAQIFNETSQNDGSFKHKAFDQSSSCNRSLNVINIRACNLWYSAKTSSNMSVSQVSKLKKNHQIFICLFVAWHIWEKYLLLMLISWLWVCCGIVLILS